MNETSSAKKVLVIENDLFFSSKINATLKQLGFKSALLSALKEINAFLKDHEICLIIIDLSIDSFDPLSLIQRLKSKSPTGTIPIIAFAEHTQKELLDGAANAGCEVVVTNRQVVQNLENLMEVSFADLAEPAETEETQTTLEMDKGPL